MEPLLCAVGQPVWFPGCIWMVCPLGRTERWEDGRSQEPPAPPSPVSASGGCSDSSCRQAPRDPDSTAPLCLPPQGQKQFLPHSAPPSTVEIIPCTKLFYCKYLKAFLFYWLDPVLLVRWLFLVNRWVNRGLYRLRNFSRIITTSKWWNWYSKYQFKTGIQKSRLQSSHS